MAPGPWLNDGSMNDEHDLFRTPFTAFLDVELELMTNATHG
jgi:hypothetical protein